MWKAIYISAFHVLVLSVLASIINWLQAKADALGKYLVYLREIVLRVFLQ